MAGLAKELFKSFYSIFAELFLAGFFVLIAFSYYGFIEISKEVTFVITTIGYGIIIVLSIVKTIRNHKKHIEETGELQRTLIITRGNMFIVEIFGFIAALGVLSIVYFSEQEFGLINVIQSLFVLLIVKAVNMYYLSRQV